MSGNPLSDVEASGSALRLASSLRPPLLTRDNGPGLRWVLFVQGCRHPCTPQCLNPRYLDPRGGMVVGVDEVVLLAEQLAVGKWGNVEGITVLGGEPTDQAESLYPILALVRGLGLSVMLYSGRPLLWFLQKENAAARLILTVTDILVDGPFVARFARQGLRWRGSTNQQIIRLTGRYSEDDVSRGLEEHGVTATIFSEGQVEIAGLQERAAVDRVEAALAESNGTVVEASKMEGAIGDLAHGARRQLGGPGQRLDPQQDVYSDRAPPVER